MVCFPRLRMIRVRKSFIERRGAEFSSRVYAVARDNGDGTFEIRKEDLAAILNTLSRRRIGTAGQPAPTAPTAAELAGNFVGAMERWSAAGFRTVTREQYHERAAICEPCEYWDGGARFGLGKCNAPGCGCTKFKRWLATEDCK